MIWQELVKRTYPPQAQPWEAEATGQVKLRTWPWKTRVVRQGYNVVDYEPTPHPSMVRRERLYQMIHYTTTVQLSNDPDENDYYINIPEEVLKILNWKEGDTLTGKSQTANRHTKVKDAEQSEEEPRDFDERYDQYISARDNYSKRSTKKPGPRILQPKHHRSNSKRLGRLLVLARKRRTWG